MQFLLLTLIRGYRLLFSPWFGSQCRFFPTCSAYAEEAIREYGAWKGFWMTIIRLSKCHPWHTGGVDPVPPRKQPETLHG